MSSEAAIAPGDSLEPIKRVTRLEAEVEQKVAALREAIRSRLDALARESEEALAKARAEAEKARDATLEAARREGDAEAQGIVANGTQRASTIRPKGPAELARQKEPILSALLAEFRAPGKRGSP